MATKKTKTSAPITNIPAYLFHQGTNYCAQDYLGVHVEGDKLLFRTWAPRATAVQVTGTFDEWSGRYPMQRITEDGVWEGSVPVCDVPEGSLYKYRLETDAGVLFKSDPYAFATACPPETASKIHYAKDFVWNDAGWMNYRKKNFSDSGLHAPMNIYEMHLGSWRRKEDGTPYTYKEYAQELPAYVKQMGFTHVEFLPVTEHPFDGSWGYQSTGYFAPSARYGDPEDFKALVNALHEAGIGVILDWVPAHFPKDAYGLYEFDGGPLYEYQGADRQEHKGWGTRMFDVARNEVECFLISSASFWLREYHVDGLRVDAVASMLYLDYDKGPGEWNPNIYGDNRSLESIAFFQKLNGHLQGQFPDVLRMAEESGDYGAVTTPASQGGLGFTHKWNMGWMNDALSYNQEWYDYRDKIHDRITFSMLYAFSEKYCLPISHDEVVHGKKSLLDKMPGDYWQKFAATRAFLGYMMTHPGKKLLFMGCELGQFTEWNYADAVEWFLLDYPSHSSMQYYVSRLNHFYLSHPVLYDLDHSWEGFQWMDANNREQSVLSYIRKDRQGNFLLIAVNLRTIAYEEYRLGAPCAGTYEEIFSSDAEEFGGSGVVNTGDLIAKEIPVGQAPASVQLRLPPIAMTILRCKRKKPQRRKKKEQEPEKKTKK